MPPRMHTSAPDTDILRLAGAGVLRLAAGTGLVLLGLAIMLGWPFVDPVAHPHVDPVLVPLALWYAVLGAAFAVGAVRGSWRRWPWRRPRLRPLRWAAGVVLMAVAPLLLSFTALLATAPVSTVGDLDFANELEIPEVLEPVDETEDGVVFQLTAQEGRRTFLPGTTTETLGFNGDYLGPTLRAERGDRVRIDVENTLEESTTVHWHGMHLPAEADGGPHQIIDPGQTWTAEWTVDQQAGTSWYHPHPHGRTGEHVYHGMAGLFLLDDPEAQELDLPSQYGVDDIPVIVQDRTFGRDGAFVMPPSLSSMGVLGEHILVNGTYDPHFTVDRELVRLRLLNGSNNRLFEFGFDDGRGFRQIAGDGGLLEAPHDTERLALSPGERAEIVVAFEPGEEVVLRGLPPQTGAVPEARVGGADSFDILLLRAEDDLDASPELPGRLADIEPVLAPGAAADAEPDRVFELGEEVIDDREMDLRRIDHVLTAGATEVWELVNTDDDPHNFHVHDKHFQVLSRNGEPPGPALGGWKDTVPVLPGETVQIALTVGSHTDPEKPYMFHCHVLTHEDNGMMGQFTVVEPGTEDDAPRTLPAPHSRGEAAHRGH